MDPTPETVIMTSRQASRSVIETLPSELLLVIFKYVYVTALYSTVHFAPCFRAKCRTEGKCFCYLEPHQARDWENDEELPPTLFPNSVASVCSRWGKIMLLVPAFWTRIIVLLDADVFPPPDLDLQLRLSGNKPLDIIVSRSSHLDVVDLKADERSRMIQIFTTLCPHLHRCQVLRIDVVHSSSLPRVIGILPPSMPHLYELSLRSGIHSGPPAVQICFLPDYETIFNWCELETVTIDGWNLLELHARTPASGKPVLSECSTLLVKFGADGFSSRIFEKLSEDAPITRLELDTITFAQGMDTPPGILSPPTLVLKNLKAEDTNLMLHMCNTLDVLTIDDCMLPSITRMPGADALVLKNISSSQSIREFIRLWRGEELWVIGCPGFDDDVLVMMGSLGNGVKSELSGLDTPRMAGLFLQDCHGFSVGALRKFVEKSGDAFQNSKTLTTLCVKGSGSPLVQEDFNWFYQKVYTFRWEL